MTAAIQPVQTQTIAPQGDRFFSESQEQMILKTFLGGATKEEAIVLLETVRRRRLDPFSRQVYFVKRWDSQKREEVWAIQTSIDGLRAIAERTGKYDGQSEPVYGEDEAGKYCKVTVYRKDWSTGRGATGVAYYTEFVQKKKDGTVTKFWKDMPRLMLAKCAEALAICKAFPEDTGGLYIAEEMPEHKDAPADPQVVEAPARTSGPQPISTVVAALKPPEEEPITAAEVWKECVRRFGEQAATMLKEARIRVGIPDDTKTADLHAPQLRELMATIQKADDIQF